MNTTRELRTAQAKTHLVSNRTHPRGRTGVRFVLTNATDPNGVRLEFLDFLPGSAPRKAIDDWK